MKFNKRSLVKVAILSAILGLNGMCFNDVVNGTEVLLETPEELRIVDPREKEAQVDNDNLVEDLECVVCFSGNQKKQLYKLGCCKQLICADCAIDNDQRSGRCPFCRNQGEVYRGTINFMKDLKEREIKLKESEKKNSDKRNQKNKDENFNEKVSRKPIALSDDFAIRLSAKEMEDLGGKRAWVATFQNKYAQNEMSNITNEKAWELFEQGKIREFEKMYDDAATYRLAQKMTMEDARDAILEKTSSNCSQNACCESERSELTSYQPKSFTSNALSDSQVQELIDQGYFN